MYVERAGKHTQQDIMGSLAPPRNKLSKRHRTNKRKTWGLEQKYPVLPLGDRNQLGK